MDDININEINIHLEEIKLDANTDEWIKLNWTNQQNDTNDEAPQVPNTQKQHLHNETWEIQTKNNNSETCTSMEPGDTSDGISVISESNPEDVSINSFQTCQLNDKTFKKRRRYITKEIVRMSIACLFGVMAGFLLHMTFMSMCYIIPPNQFLSRISNETLITTTHNIINTYKELAEVKTLLSEIEIYTKPTNHEISIKDILAQVLGNINSSKISNKPIIESLDSNLHPLNQLQLLLYVLSHTHAPSVIKINDINGFPKNKINKTLDIMNNVKAFYETLILLKNDIQNVNNLIIIKFLHNSADKIHIASELLLSDLLEKMNKATLNVYNKYIKLAHKLREKLCHLKNVLSDNNEFLKQLTENNQLFENYDKSCFSNYSSENLSDKTTMNRDTKRNNVKNRIEKFDPVYVKHDEMNISKVYNNNSLKNESNKTQNTNSSTTKISKNTNDKIGCTSELSLSKKLLPESMNEIILNMYNEYNKKRNPSNKEWCHLENILEELLNLSKNNEKNNKNSIDWCARIDDILRSIGIEKTDMLKNSFNNISIQNPYISSHANNYCSKNNIDMFTPDIVSKDKTNYIVISNKKHNVDIARTMADCKSSGQILLTIEKNELKKKDSLKSNVPSKTIFNNNNKKSIKRNNSLQKNTKRHISQKEIINYHKRKSKFKCMTQQNNQHCMERSSEKRRFSEEILLQDDSDWYFLRSNSRKNARKKYTEYNSDWYSQWAYSRKNARKYMKYQQNTKFRKKHS